MIGTDVPPQSHTAHETAEQGRRRPSSQASLVSQYSTVSFECENWTCPAPVDPRVWQKAAAAARPATPRLRGKGNKAWELVKKSIGKKPAVVHHHPYAHPSNLYVERRPPKPVWHPGHWVDTLFPRKVPQGVVLPPMKHPRAPLKQRLQTVFKRKSELPAVDWT